MTESGNDETILDLAAKRRRLLGRRDRTPTAIAAGFPTS